MLPSITAGTLAGSDAAAFTQSFDTKNVGTGKALTPVGSVVDGNGGANYLVTFVADATGVISARPITVTAGSDTKVYDGTTASSVVPSISTGTLAGSDVAAFTQSFDTAAVATGKTSTPAGSVLDGNGGLNYAVTFANDTTGVITAAPVTVTADAGQSKVYGAADPVAFTYHTSGLVGAETLTGALARVAGENAGTYAINQGTLASSNYTITFHAADFTIDQRPITVTAGTDSKTYDATTVSSVVPTITTGTLAFFDTPSFTQSFDTKNVGTGKTLTPTGLVVDGNGGANYAVTFAPDTTGVISARAITVTAGTDTKTYDGSTSSLVVPSITAGTLAGSDAAASRRRSTPRRWGPARP